MDYLRQPFPTMANIIAVADTVDKLKSICMECKGDALYSFRTTSETETVSIGAEESYMPLCKKCYIKQIE
jgi:thymidine kinase